MIKKILTALILIVLVLLLFVFFYRAKVISFLLKRDFKIPVSIQKIERKNNKLVATKVQIENLKKKNSPGAFYSAEASLVTTLKNLFGNTLTIDSLHFKDVDIYIEYYNKSGSENNWSDIINVETGTSKKQRPYLIKTLIFENLYVTVYSNDGSAKKYPIIQKLVIDNVTSESGFPVDQIEKAIFNAVLKSIFKQLNLENLLRTINPKKSIPKIIKKIPFIGFDEPKNQSDI